MALDSPDPYKQLYDRAVLLIQLRRYKEAEQLLGSYLAQNPQDAMAHALMAHALVRQPGRQEDALREARAAIHCDPNLEEGYYILGIAQSGRDPSAAQEAFESALRIDPHQARFYAALGHLHLARGRLKQALDAALAGRKADALDVGCANLQSVALMRLGRGKEAYAVAREALRLDPENAQAHAEQGWTLLMNAQPALACVSFGHALRIDPRLENAREGLVEAMKARWPVYALLLRVLLWMEQHRNGRWGWGLFLAIIVPPAVGLALIGQQPGLGILLIYCAILPFAIAILARLARPSFDLLLRLDPYARLSLSREQRIASNWVIAGPLIFLASILVMAISGSPEAGILVLIILLVVTRLLLGAGNPEDRKDEMRPF